MTTSPSKKTNHQNHQPPHTITLVLARIETLTVPIKTRNRSDKQAKAAIEVRDGEMVWMIN